jgi:hypothetical protein
MGEIIASRGFNWPRPLMYARHQSLLQTSRSPTAPSATTDLFSRHPENNGSSASAALSSASAWESGGAAPDDRGRRDPVTLG